METEKEKVVKKINRKLVDHDINNYYCEQDKEDLIIKDKNKIHNYIFKFNNFNSSLLEINKTIIYYLFIKRKEDILYELHNMPNCLLANSKNIIEICKEELDGYFINNILCDFENKYEYKFYYYDNCNMITIKNYSSERTLIALYRQNQEWNIGNCENLLNCQVDEFLELKGIINELLSQLNKKRKE